MIFLQKSQEISIFLLTYTSQLRLRLFPCFFQLTDHLSFCLQPSTESVLSTKSGRKFVACATYLQLLSVKVK
jgi:hypothetical protein